MYKGLYGIVKTSSNDTLLILGYISTLSLPPVTLFDCNDYIVLHVVFAVAFFTSSSIYQYKLSTYIQNNVDKFPGMTDKVSYIVGLKMLGLLGLGGFVIAGIM